MNLWTREMRRQRRGEGSDGEKRPSPKCARLRRGLSSLWLQASHRTGGGPFDVVIKMKTIIRLFFWYNGKGARACGRQWVV